MNEKSDFTSEQQSYLQGFALGADVSRKVRGLPIISGSASPADVQQAVIGGSILSDSGYASVPELIHHAAQDKQIAAGGKLVAEEQAKRDKNPLDMWEEMRERADAGEFPKKTDVFLTKFHGLFYVAPAQNSYMCRLRFPGGAISAWQMRGLADLSDRFAGGYADCTTRANLQLREIGAENPINVLMGLRDLGIINTGAGGDNIRNITASPLSGLDPTELIETLPLAREIHHTIIAHREFYGLPRKFNIALDGGGRISALEDTNDIGFTAVRVGESSADASTPPGVYFLLTLGGITGHKDFARYTGVLLKPQQCSAVASSIIRVFISSGNRTDRNKARLKYVLDDWGFERFISEVEKDLGYALNKVPIERIDPRASDQRWAHVGVHPQKQSGLNYIGVVLPVGRMTSDQMRGLADIAQTCGSGDIRLTVWQNLLIPNVRDDLVMQATQRIADLGLTHKAASVRAGLVACTGNAGCKYAASNTKLHAMQIADFVEERLELDHPINIHVTGCHHSCAQHYIGDIGLIATKVEDGDDMVEGYDLYVGGGYGERQRLACELCPSLRHDEVPHVVLALLSGYMERRLDPTESFDQFASRTSLAEMQELTGRSVAS